MSDQENPQPEHEVNTIEEAGGVAVGLTGHIHDFDDNVASLFSNAMFATGQWVEDKSGPLLGHIKAAIYDDDGRGITFNLTNMDNGVEQHGTLAPQEEVNFNFMSAVIDVDYEELEHFMENALKDSGIDFVLEEHHHDHDHHHH